MNRIIPLILCLVLLSGCGGSKVREIDAATDPAEDSDFSSADYFKITDVMMTSIEANGFFDRYRSEHGGEKPVLLLAKSLQNNTDEHIDTRLILVRMVASQSYFENGYEVKLLEPCLRSQEPGFSL